jgi:hypothetical protein
MGMTTALLATGIIGMGMSAYGQYREGQDAAEASQYNANMARQSSEMEAKMVEQSGELDASRQRKQVSRLIGTQKAYYAGSGVELSGSPLDLMIETAAEGELDAQIMEWNAKTKASAIRYGGQSQAAYDEKMAGTYARSGMYRAGSTLLTQGSKIGLGYMGGYSSNSFKSSDGIAGQVYQGGVVKTGDYSRYGGY